MYWGSGVGVTEGDGEVEGVMEDDIDIDAVTDGVVEALGVPEEVGDGETLALGVAVIEGEEVADGEGEGGGRLGQAGGIGGAPEWRMTAEVIVHPKPTATHHQPCHPHKSKLETKYQLESVGMCLVCEHDAIIFIASNVAAGEGRSCSYL